MHIHFRELFCKLFARCKAVFPEFTWSTAFETWGKTLSRRIVASIRDSNQTGYYTCHYELSLSLSRLFLCSLLPATLYCWANLLVPRPRQPYPEKSAYKKTYVRNSNSHHLIQRDWLCGETEIPVASLTHCPKTCEFSYWTFPSRKKKDLPGVQSQKACLRLVHNGICPIPCQCI